MREGIGLTEAVDRAVRSLLGDEADLRRREIEHRKRVIDEVVEHAKALPVCDPRPWQIINDEMCGEYGEPV